VSVRNFRLDYALFELFGDEPKIDAVGRQFVATCRNGYAQRSSMLQTMMIMFTSYAFSKTLSNHITFSVFIAFY